MMMLLEQSDSPGETAGIFWLESDFLREKTDLSADNLAERRERWAVLPGWNKYLSACRAGLGRRRIFPGRAGFQSFGCSCNL